MSLLWNFFNRHIAVFFETSVLKEVRILRYLHNNSVVLILMLSSEKSYPILYLYMLEKLLYVAEFFNNVFYTFYFFNFSTLFFIKLFSFFEKLKAYLKVSFSTKLQADYYKKEIAAHVFFSQICKIFKNTFLKNISGELILDMKFFQAIFYTFSRKFGIFRVRFIFAIISLFLLLVPGFRNPWSPGIWINRVTGQNRDYIDKVFMQAFKH